MRVLTLNIWGLAWPLSRDLDLRVEAIGKSLPGLRLDAAAFQEVWSDGSRMKLIELGAAAGLRHAWFPPEGAGGLLVLSRHEPTDARFSPMNPLGEPLLIPKQCRDS